MPVDLNVTTRSWRGFKAKGVNLSASFLLVLPLFLLLFKKEERGKRLLGWRIGAVVQIFTTISRSIHGYAKPSEQAFSVEKSPNVGR